MKNTKNLKGLLLAFTLILITGVAFALATTSPKIDGTAVYTPIEVRIIPDTASSAGANWADTTWAANSSGAVTVNFTAVFTGTDTATYNFAIKNLSTFSVQCTSATVTVDGVEYGAYITGGGDEVTIGGTFADALIFNTDGTLTPSGGNQTTTNLTFTITNGVGLTSTPVAIVLTFNYTQV